MALENLLAKRKSTIVKSWFNLVVETYPADTAKFLKSQKDPFANPVGRNTHKGLDTLFDGVLGHADKEAVETFLDPIIRIRAIQDFTPSQAIGFIFPLKKLIRDLVQKETKNDFDAGDLLPFESRIDALALIAFDIYVKCREKIYEIKATEERNRTFKAFKRAGLIHEKPDAAPDKKKPISMS
jgi:RsbT co-antagonist protein rsbRD N-terminal domain